MAFAITNKNLQSNIPGLLNPLVGSTALNQIVSSATTTSTSIAATRWEFADYTSTEGWIPKTTQVRDGGVGDFVFEHLAYRALVSLKSVTGLGSATSTFGNASFAVTLEAATSTAAFTGSGSTGQSNAVILDTKVLSQIGGTSTSATVSLYLFGQFPVVGGAKFARVGVEQIGGQSVNISSTAIDVVIEGVS